MTILSEAILHNSKGIALILHDPLVVRVLRPHADFFLLDAASRPCDAGTMHGLMMAAGDTPFLVRPENTTKSALQSLLNMGVDGLVLPDIHHAAELEKIIASCLFPPEGARPFRPIITHEKIAFEALNDQITFLVEIAHLQTIAQLEQIAEVTGVNGFIVNPMRLAVAMERGMDSGHPGVAGALHSIARIAASYELPWGLEGRMDSALDLRPHFTLPMRDVDQLTAGFAAQPVQRPAPEEEAYPPVMLAARRD